MAYHYTHEYGVVRIVNAVCSIVLYGAPLVLIYFGTATTFCYIDEKKAYFGGIIAPGIKISMDALYSNASKLPKIEIEKPNNIIGQSTVEGMQSDRKSDV